MSTLTLFRLPLQQRHRFGWYLFDFATSFLIINGGLYFPQWIIIDNKGSDFWFNFAIATTAVLLITTAPLVGFIIDKRRNGMTVLRICSAVMFASTFSIFFASMFVNSQELRVVLGLICFVVLMYSYQIAIVFYNTLLPDIAAASQFSRTSGRGLASGWLGGIIGIATIYPFVNGSLPHLGPASRSHAFLPAASCYGILVLLSLFCLRDLPARGSPSTIPLGRLYKDTWRSVLDLLRDRNIRMFLFSFLLFSDAVLTIQNNASIYLSVVLHLSDAAKAIQVLILLFTAAIGGLSSGHLTRRFGLTRTMFGLLIAWPVVLVVTAGVSDVVVFSFIFACVGFLFGATWSVSRVLFLLQIPMDKQTESFGLYSSFERFASLLGPLVWGGTVLMLSSLADTRYRIAMLMMIPFLIFAAIIFHRGKYREQYP